MAVALRPAAPEGLFRSWRTQVTDLDRPFQVELYRQGGNVVRTSAIILESSTFMQIMLKPGNLAIAENHVTKKQNAFLENWLTLVRMTKALLNSFQSIAAQPQ